MLEQCKEMERLKVSIIILGISEMRWSCFNFSYFNDHRIYYSGTTASGVHEYGVGVIVINKKSLN